MLMGWIDKFISQWFCWYIITSNVAIGFIILTKMRERESSGGVKGKSEGFELKRGGGEMIIKNGQLIFDSYVIAYENQVIYDHDKMYLAELGQSIFIDQTLLEYDDYFYHQHLQQQLLSQIQVLDPSTALQIIQQLPNLNQHHYSFLLQQLTLQKLQQLIANDHFFIFLLTTFQKIIYNNSISLRDQQLLMQKNVIENMTSIYQRLFYLLMNIEGVDSMIRTSMECLSNQIILTFINQPNYIKQLAFTTQHPKTQSSKEASTFNLHFLTHIINTIIFMQYISQSYFQEQKLTKGNFHLSVINQLIFTKECLNIIATHFNSLFIYHRNQLLLTLCFIGNLENHSVWTEIISFEYLVQEQSSSEEMEVNERNVKGLRQKGGQQERRGVNNESGFKHLIMNCYLNCTSGDWSSGLYLLQKLTNPKITINIHSINLLAAIFQEIIELGIGIQQIDLITLFITRNKQKNKQGSKFRQLISHFLKMVNHLVQNQYKSFERQSKIMSKSNRKGNQSARSSTLRLNSKLICCLLRTFSKLLERNILESFVDYEYVSSIQKLLKICKNKKGLMESAKRCLIKLIKTEYRRQGQKTLSKKKLSTGLLQNYSSKKYHLNQAKSAQTAIQKLVKIIQTLQIC